MPKEKFLRPVPSRNRLCHRSCRQHRIHLTVTFAFGLVHRNYGLRYPKTECGATCRTTLQTTPDFVRKSSGGVKVTTGAKKILRNLPSPESDWINQHPRSPLTNTQTQDGRVIPTMPSWCTGFSFRLSGAGRLLDTTRAKN